MSFSEDAATQLILASIAVKREDITRAKEAINESSGVNTVGMAQAWLEKQGFREIREVDLQSENCEEILLRLARDYSLRMAFFQAAWELVAAGIRVPEGSAAWPPSLTYRNSGFRGGSETVRKPPLTLPVPEKIWRLPLTSEVPGDSDLFLSGVDRTTLHSGIVEAIEQSLLCFRRGLFMPATAMLGAAIEAAWTECGTAAAKAIPDALLEQTLARQVSFGGLVTQVHKSLIHANAKPLLRAAGREAYQVRDAEVWTTVLRERRNALHWGKAKSFIADHSETATLLLATPQHLSTLEAIRLAC